ncbi:MAG: 4-hydroxy-tetrahydrodipicolinate reductase [Defluviitaleaceae bacterium]|nr:4-hydroxy-tetrahydrodipicolinate reductase [Defluviitaleaceae bacterium]
MENLNVIIHGFGQLGKATAQLAGASGMAVVAAIDTSADASMPFPVFKSLDECKMQADVIIDCSHAAAVSALVDAAAEREIPLVICTTGLDEKTLKNIEEKSGTFPIFLSSNMSLGVNLVSKLAADATTVLDGAGFDIEIIEAHHNKKMDAPSGTAIMLAKSINDAANGKFNYVHDRSKVFQKRGENEIGISAIRGGTIVGEHTIIFAGQDEIIEITHKAASRDIFAKGALAAARFIKNKPAGLYNMNNLLNE